MVFKFQIALFSFKITQFLRFGDIDWVTVFLPTFFLLIYFSAAILAVGGHPSQKYSEQRSRSRNNRQLFKKKKKFYELPYGKAIFISEFLTCIMILMMSNRYSDLELKNEISENFLKALVTVMTLNFLLHTYAFYNTVLKPIMLLTKVYKGKEVKIENYKNLKENLTSFKINAKFRRLVTLFLYP